MQAKVSIRNNFPSTTRKFERAAHRGVDRASRHGMSVQRSAPTRYRIRHILGAAVLVRARVVGGGWITGGWRNTDFRQVFFEYGTLTKRTKPLKQPRRRKVKRGGIEPQYAMTKGRAAARSKLPLFVGEELAKVR